MKYILVIDHIATGGAERILVDYYHYLENMDMKHMSLSYQDIREKANGQKV